MIYNVKCLDPNCNTERIVDTSKWNANFPTMKIACPKCTKLIREDANPNYKPVLKTMVISPKRLITEEIDVERVGWIIKVSDKSYYALKQGINSIGRKQSSKASSISIDSQDVYFSGAHCIINAVRDKNSIMYFIQDNNSKNGIVLNNERRLHPDEIYHLQDDDVFMLGQSQFKFISIFKAKDEEELKLIVNN